MCSLNACYFVICGYGVKFRYSAAKSCGWVNAVGPTNTSLHGVNGSQPNVSSHSCSAHGRIESS